MYDLVQFTDSPCMEAVFFSFTQGSLKYYLIYTSLCKMCVHCFVVIGTGKRRQISDP